MKQFNFDEIDDRIFINDALKKNPKRFVESVERKYHDAVAKVSQMIADHSEKHKIIMLCGPSGSGKTTTALMLAKRLKQEHNVNAVTISLDNFYLGENQAPLLENGRYDYETVHALDVKAIHASFLSLIETGRCEMPKFSFKSRKPSEKTLHVELKAGDVAIVEGIHAMNPLIVDALPEDSLYKLYVSVENGIYENGKMILSPREIRLLRRMIRDHYFRSSSPQHTLVLWDGVVEGEEKYLFPFADTADMKINSFHSFEPCVYREIAIDLLGQVKRDEHNYELASALIHSLVPFQSLHGQNVPETSLIREFIGGSVYY